MSLSETQKLQLSHRSVRRFQTRPLEPGQLDALIRCGQGAASSSFIQAYAVVRVTRPQARSSIAALAGGQAWIEDAPEFLVFCADLRRLEQACVRVGEGALEGYAEHSLAAVVDVSLMAQNVLLAAESQGLGGVFIGGIRNDPQQISDLLSLPELVMPVFGMCLGWPAEDNEVKPRLPLQVVLMEDVYQDTPETLMAGYDEQMARYYRDRQSNRRLSDWRSVAARALQRKKREHMLGFMQARRLFRR